MIVRRSIPADAAAIAALSRKTFYDSFAAFNTDENMQLFMDGPFKTEKLIEEAADPAEVFFVAESSGKLSGYVLLKDDTKPALAGLNAIELSRIYIDKDSVGQGIGKLLMDAAIDFAKRQQKNCIWLGVWEHNTKAIAFYQREGYEKFGEHIFLLGEDPQKDWLMKKAI